jgi:hypothetical protein
MKSIVSSCPGRVRVRFSGVSVAEVRREGERHRRPTVSLVEYFISMLLSL